MSTLLAVVLVCSLSTKPANCSRETALDIVVQPCGLPTECLKIGPMLAAETFPDLSGRYVKTVCERRKG